MVDNLTAIFKKTSGNFFLRKGSDRSDRSDNAYCRNGYRMSDLTRTGRTGRKGRTDHRGRGHVPALALGLGLGRHGGRGKESLSRKFLYQGIAANGGGRQHE